MGARHATTPIPEVQFFYRAHDGSHMRVWKSTWSGDTFELVTREEFEQTQKIFRKYAIRLTEAED